MEPEERIPLNIKQAIIRTYVEVTKMGCGCESSKHCVVCGKSFETEERLRAHLKRVHNLEQTM